MDKQALRASPFHLDDAALAWVEATLGQMTVEDKVAQIVIPLCRDLSPGSLDRMLALKHLCRSTGRK
jgi:beta-N-acetylhexosaminidase